MKTQPIHSQSSALCLWLWLCCLLPHGLQAQGTAFTYQGRLTDNGQPANGNYDLQFYLRDALVAGNPVGATNTLAPVPVNNGLFTVALDLGATVFDGSARWLEIGVRTNGSSGLFTTLAPRQQITSTPYAVRSLGATSADTAKTATSVAWTNLVGQPSGYLAGGGLTLSTSIFSDQFKVFSVAFGTDGSELTAARSDHQHFGQKWNGSAAEGLEIHTSSTSPGAAGLIGQVTGTTPGDFSAGVRGISEGTGNKGIGVYGSQDGSGWGVYGKAAQGKGVVGESTSGSGVYGTTSGAGSDVAGVYGKSPSINGTGVYGSSAGASGEGVRGEANASGAFGVSGRSTSGTGVRGSTDTGRAVDGVTFNGGVGVYGNNLGSNTKGYAGDFFGRVRVTGDFALNNGNLVLSGGAIKVTGAGVGAATPVFIHQATAANTVSAATFINNPLTNGDPNAILIVTINRNAQSVVSVGAEYNSNVGKWEIYNTDFSNMTVGATFSVLVVKP